MHKVIKNIFPIEWNLAKKYWEDASNIDYSIEDYAIGKEWDNVKIGTNSKKYFNLCKPKLNTPCFTISAGSANLSAASVCHPYQKRKLNIEEVRMCSSYPLDYNFLELNPINIMGRSVLPVMMANIAHQIYLQWLSKI